LSCISAICTPNTLAGSHAAAMQQPSTNLLDIHTECNNIHLFIASWCYLFATFTWWCYW